ncbi:MAG: hypothetical protein AUK20_00285 [Parcubacteria group bacterium CG2_30_45_37]|nr:MAG: hypothetical protein AUK20_00285 [Parcubacteria group bacterium CG2_30_45_37]
MKSQFLICWFIKNKNKKVRPSRRDQPAKIIAPANLSGNQPEHGEKGRFRASTQTERFLIIKAKKGSD